MTLRLIFTLVVCPALPVRAAPDAEICKEAVGELAPKTVTRPGYPPHVKIVTLPGLVARMPVIRQLVGAGHFAWGGVKLGWDALHGVQQFVDGRPRLWNHAWREESWAKKPYRVFQDWLHPVLRLLSPIYLPRAYTPTYPIFTKLWHDSTYTPIADEAAILDKFRARAKFDEKKAFMAKHPYWTKVRKGIGWTFEGARQVTLLLALNLLYHQIEGGLIPVETYLEAPEYELGPHQVRLLNETVPFPHTAIQIGSRVYSYGQTHLSRQPVNQYLRHREIRRKILAERQRQGLPLFETEPAEAPKTSSAKVNASVGDAAGKVADALGLDQLPQSLQAITLNLTVQEVQNLQRYLELQVGKQYANVTMVNDCATMVMRALAKHTSVKVTSLIDASPAQVFLWFAAEKSRGATYVGTIHQITVEDQTHPYRHLTRNFYINVLESKLFIEFFVLNQLQRGYVEVTHDDQKLQHHDPVTRQVIEEYEKGFQEEIKKDDQVLLWEEHKIPALIERSKAGEDVEKDVRALARFMNEYFDEKITESDRLLEQPNLEFLDILKHRLRRSLYEQKRIDLLLKLSRIP